MDAQKRNINAGESLKDKLKEELREWKSEIKNYKYHIFISIIIIIFATYIDYLAGTYTTQMAVVSNVHDLILDHFGPYDLSLFFIWGYLILFSLIILYSFVLHPKKVHIVLIQISLLVLIRSFFIILTHLQTPLDAISAQFPSYIAVLRFENDLFFSGHTAFIFLGYLIYRKKAIGKIFLIGSFLMAFIVLAMHQHYSIDVFAAFFITYCSYLIGESILKKVEVKQF